MANHIIQRAELAGGATVGGVEVINSAGVVVASSVVGAFNVATNLTYTKEVNHTESVTTSTTATANGGNLSVAAGVGATTGTGGTYTAAAGAGGNNGIGGASHFKGGASGGGNNAGGATDLTGGAGAGTGAGGVAAVVGGASGAGVTGKGGAAQVTGGAALSTNDDGGSVVLTGGAKAGSGIAGLVFNKSMVVQKQGTPTAKTVSATLTAAELLAGIITVNQAAGAPSALQFPTGTAIQNALPTAFAADDSFDVYIINTSTVDAEDASVTVNTDVTIVGSPDIVAHSGITLNSSATFRFRKTADHVFVAYRIS